MKVKWHRYVHIAGKSEHVLYVGEWEWRIRPIEQLGFARWCLTGRGVAGLTDCSSSLTRTLKQAKACCEDAALRVVERCADDLGMRLVPKRAKKARD